VVLIGAVDARPDDLERELLRYGFQVVEAEDIDQIQGRPALVVVTCGALSADYTALLSAVTSARPSGAQVVALINGGTPEDLVRAAETGADEAVLLPGEASLLAARLWARVVSPRVSAHGPAGNDLRLVTILQQVAAEMYRDDMLHALVRGLAAALELRSVTCLLHQVGADHGRVAAASDAPKLRDESTQLAWWPEAARALDQRETVYYRTGEFELLSGAAGAGAPSSDGRVVDAVAAIVLAPLGRAIGTVVLRTHVGDRPLQPGHVAFAERAVAAVCSLLEAEERRAAVSRRQANASEIDQLTGCGTLDALDRRLRDEFERARRYNVSFALVLIDVDAMRVINDRLGRDGGHKVLADLGRLFQRELRSPDYVARYGGEEFVLLLPQTDADGARGTVHRIREHLGAAGLVELHPGVRCRLSAGVVTYPHPDVHKPEDLFGLVEAALGRGKAQDGERIGVAA
jgi:diguanylate cyclase (GGDEF)-like protein